MPESICYSFHAAKRCMERGITERNVADTVRLGCRISFDGEKSVYARGRMRVVMLGDGLVITAYRQRKRNPKRCIQKRRKLHRQYGRGAAMKKWAYYNEFDPFAAAWLRELIKAGLIAPGEVDERSIADVAATDLVGFTQCHFFAGIGVWSYALRCAGWPDDRPVWTGSCPCQPFSSAGKGAGFKDERHLWPEFYRLISQCRPAICFGEQVASKDGLAWLDLVQADMENADYAFGAVDTCAAGVGAPHIRQRLYWVGFDTLGNTSLRGCVGREVGNKAGSKRSALGSREDERCRRHDVADDGTYVRMGNAEPQRLQGWLRGGEDSGRENKYGHVGRNCTVGGLAHAEHEQRQGCISGCGEKFGEDGCGPASELARCCKAIRLEHPSGIGRERREAPAPGDHDDGATPQRQEGQHGPCLAGSHRLPEDRPGPTNGFWRDSDWLLCRDGKFRPVRPGSFPLVNGAAARVGRLRGYGNAVNKEQAQAFIESVMDVLT